MKLVQFDFPYRGPFGAEMAEAMEELARSIVDEPGFLWKIWTENAETSEAGGIYAFADADSATAYIEKHSARLGGFGISGIRAKVFDVNGPLSQITGAPI